MIKIVSLAISDVLLIAPNVFKDDRGFFFECYNKRALAKAGLDVEFVQDNHSYSAQKGTVRGLHFQTAPHVQGKLVRVVQGCIYDVVVDLRRSSPTFGKHVGARLSADNRNQLWVPPGFAHGFCTLEDDVEVLYKTTDYYVPECDAGIIWNNASFDIDWPVSVGEVVLSKKDAISPTFEAFPKDRLFD